MLTAWRLPLYILDSRFIYLFTFAFIAYTKKEAKILYAFYAMLRTMKDNYENIVQRFHVIGGVGGFFGDFVSHTAQNTLGKMCSGETETETETGTTAANNCRKRTQRAGRPEIRDSPNIAIGFCSRSHSDSDSPSLALCRTSALSIALSLRT